MKKRLNIFFLLIAVITIIAMQACGTKTETTNGESTATATESVSPTLAEKRAKIEQIRAERTERRRIEAELLAKTTPTYKDAEGNVIYNKAETDPSYDGGKDAMTAFLRDNVKYPKEAQEKQIEGTVFVDFVIAKNGNVREVMVTDQTNEDVDQSFRTEAIRVVTSMPKWLPGRQHGDAVDVKFSIPITFELI
jgi:periplasmic protein TonB